MSISPIGFFDSGIGGVSVWKEVTQLLPDENTIYYADSKNSPYGSKSISEIQNISIINSNWLIDKGCKLIVVACNTATTNSIKTLRKSTSIPIIGIEPGVKPAINYTKTNNIGLLATKKTIGSNLFFQTLSQNKNINIKIHKQIGHNLVNMIEKDEIEKKEMYETLTNYLTPMINKKIDCLVLGCTHYNYLINIIREIIPKNINLIDTITPVANHTIKTLKSNNILNKSKKAGVVKVFFNGNNLNQKYISKNYELSFLKF